MHHISSPCTSNIDRAVASINNQHIVCWMLLMMTTFANNMRNPDATQDDKLVDKTAHGLIPDSPSSECLHPFSSSILEGQRKQAANGCDAHICSTLSGQSAQARASKETNTEGSLPYGKYPCKSGEGGAAIGQQELLPQLLKLQPPPSAHPSPLRPSISVLRRQLGARFWNPGQRGHGGPQLGVGLQYKLQCHA